VQLGAKIHPGIETALCALVPAALVASIGAGLQLADRGIEPNIAPWLGPAIAAIILAALGGLALVWRPWLATIGLLAIPAFGVSFFEEHPIDLGPAKLYWFDAWFFLFLGLIGLLWVNRRVGESLWPPRNAPRLLVPLTLMLCLGTFQTLRGLKLGQEFNDALGDFRRGYVYLLAYLFPFLLRAHSTADSFRVNSTRLLLGTAVGLSLVGVGQLLLGKLDRRMATDAAHILAHFELTLVAAAGAWGLGAVLRSRDANETTYGLTAMVGALLVVIAGNFRAVWLGIAGGGALLFFCLPARFRVAMTAIGLAVALFGAVLLFLVRDVPLGGSGTTLGKELATKVDRLKNISRDQNILWRIQSYKAAWEKFIERPALGAGLGMKTTFQVIRSDGSIASVSRHRTHNSYLWVLSTTGIVGLSVFLFWHVSWLALIFAHLRDTAARRIPPEPLLVGLIGFYGVFMTATGFDVLLEQSIPILWLSWAMGTADVLARRET